MQVNQIVAWMKERHSIYTKRSQGLPRPWTKDEIMLSYRFCNVYRELDTVTMWIAENCRGPFFGHPDLWFAMALSRLVNWPDTMEEMDVEHDILDNWDPDMFVEVMHRRKNAGLKTFSGAYIVSTNGNKMDKAEYLATTVLSPLWDARAKIRPKLEDNLASFAARLSQHVGMGSFLSAQVVADIKYVNPLKRADDWWTWASSGPGSRRGLNRVMGWDTEKPWKETAWAETLRELHKWVNAKIGDTMPAVHAQDLQNCLCEFDKYERTRLGEGRPRSTYPGRG